MAQHNDLGVLGERAAHRYLEQLKYKILDTNWSIDGKKEVDIFATDERELIVIEVKTRSEDYSVSPLSAVTRRKQANIISLTNAYIRLKGITLPIRFDVLTAVFHPFDQSFDIEYYKDAFRATVRKKY